ncbi:MAG: hypothetical protein KC766_21450 [Myxococcales bacterium]|nr:hypothetical protein [Myxococcales bacterium]
MPIVPRSPTPGRVPRAAKPSPDEPELLTLVRTEVHDSTIGVTSEPRAGVTPFSSGNLELEPPLFCELAELLTYWESLRHRWSLCLAEGDVVTRFSPGSVTPERRSDPASGEWLRRARALELVCCYDEFFVDWEVAAVLVSGLDEAVGVWVLGPGDLHCLLTRRAAFVGTELDEPSCLLAARCLSGGHSELDRARLARLQGLLIGPGAVADLQRVAEEFSSLRAVNFEL